VLPRTVAHPAIRLDIGGMVLIGIALTAIIYPLIQGRTEGWPAWTFVLFAVGAVLLGVFVLWERRLHGDPLVEPGLLANRAYTSGILVALAFFGAFGGLLLCVSLFAQLGEHFSPVHAGLTLMAMVVGMIVGMGVGFALVGRLGRHLLHSGIVVVAAGSVVLALTVTGARSASTLDLAPGLFLIGLGAGSSIGQLFDFILAGVSMSEVGSASGVLEAVQQLSSALGVAVLGTIFFSTLGGHLPTHALAITAWACLVPLAATFLLLFKLPMRAREPQSLTEAGGGIS
jgi:predicted MFS family arabinose efflux permease